ncbi:hypothetical protein K402DRAFT_325517 [Aulographum hederae CBS 113979]|uniref:Cytoplasmic tRNA 2-thiolation protein 2 n=1 Tax=Aulographum hederae CBS 113979 TaxID=1176131 RepID=A0A6G1H9Q4_9PEZI|nr:hypothetical protein K402DRAFT_325517 [Aulographum hederae CBS 113979]
MDNPNHGQTCRRCGLASSTIVRSEPLCQVCFVKYVSTKTVKRLETFAVRHSEPDKERRLLLPLSMGVSSLTLLHILQGHLNRQIERTGRTGFSLHVVFVDCSIIDDAAPTVVSLRTVQERFPGPIYSTVRLEDIFKTQDHGHGETEPNDGSATAKLFALFSALPSPTSRIDVASNILTRLVVDVALSSSCEAVLWGDSTTRLAEKTLSETAKGRGFSLPWQIGDGSTPFGLAFHYPLRDLLKKELVAHASIVSPPLEPLVNISSSPAHQVAVSAKNTTIDFLMKQYFESVEENYPSIVANVVRTATKLETSTSTPERRCRLCKMPITEDLLGIHGWGGDETDAVPSSGAELGHGLCYGCTRSVPVEAIDLLPT